MFQIKALANIDTAIQHDDFVKVYLNNYFASQENEAGRGKLESLKLLLLIPKIVTKVQKQIHVSISIRNNIGLSQTANLPAKLKLCVGARVILADNIRVSDRLINDSIGTVRWEIKATCSTIQVKFDDPKVGNSLKRILCDDLKGCVSITARAKKFP